MSSYMYKRSVAISDELISLRLLGSVYAIYF